MIRSVAIVVLTMAALCTLALGAASFACRSALPDLLVGRFIPIPGLTISYDRLFCIVAALGADPGTTFSRTERPGQNNVPGLFREFDISGDRYLCTYAVDGRLSVSYLGESDPARTTAIQRGSSLWGFAAYYGIMCPRPSSLGRRMFIVRVPLWAPFLLFAAYPALALVGPLRCRRRQKRGLCVKCGYALTGLTEPRCPECGKPFDPGPVAGRQ